MNKLRSIYYDIKPEEHHFTPRGGYIHKGFRKKFDGIEAVLDYLILFKIERVKNAVVNVVRHYQYVLSVWKDSVVKKVRLKFESVRSKVQQGLVVEFLNVKKKVKEVIK